MIDRGGDSNRAEIRRAARLIAKRAKARGATLPRAGATTWPGRGLLQARLLAGVKRLPQAVAGWLDGFRIAECSTRRAFLVGGIALAGLATADPALAALRHPIISTTGDVLSVEVLSDDVLLAGVIRPEGAIIRTVFKGLAAGLSHDLSKWSITMSMPGFANAPTNNSDTSPPTTTTAIAVTCVAQARYTGKLASAAEGTTAPINYIEYVNPAGDLETYHILSQEIPAGVTISVSVAAGAVTGSLASKSGLTRVTNASSKAHRRPHCQFVTLPHMLVQGGSVVPVEIAAFHAWAQQKSEVACILVRARNAVTGGTVGSHLWINTMSASTELTGGGTTVQVYKGNVDLTGLARQVCYLEFVAFPWWGTDVFDSNNILGGGQDGTTLDSATTQLSNTAALRRLNQNCPAVLDFFNDTTSTYGQSWARVNASTGNDATGAVYASEAAAIAGNAYASYDAAKAGARTYNNTNFSRLDDGNTVYVMDNGTHYMAGVAAPANLAQNVGACWSFIRKRSTSNLGDAIFSANNGGVVIAQAQRALGRRIRVQGMAFAGVDNTVANTNTWLYGGDFGNLSEVVIEACSMTKPSGTTSGSLTPNWHYGVHLIWLRNNTMNYVGTSTAPASGNQSVVLGGNDMTGCGVTGCHYFIGNKTTDCSLNLDAVKVFNSSYVQIQEYLDAFIGAFNDIKSTTASGSGTVISVILLAPSKNNTSGQREAVNGCVWVCNQIDTSDTVAAPAKCMEIAADGSSSNCSDIVFHCNSFFGERLNAWYNENASTGPLYKSPVFRYNVGDNFNQKRDTNNAGGQIKEERRTGVYLAGYGVNGDGNVFNGSAGYSASSWLSWGQDRFPGRAITGTSALYDMSVVSNTSISGTPSSSRGDYRPTAGNSWLTQRPAGMSPLPMDLFGGAVNDNAAGPAGPRIAA